METNTYYNRVYLCSQYIASFKCKKFNTFKEADDHHIETYKNKKEKHSNNILPINNNVSTLIPICKYVPLFMDKWILRYKLRNMLYVNIE